MQLSRLEIQHLRNLTGAKVTPGSIFNLIYGENGSGKTSFLEAIYFLGLGKSFRTHHNQRVIQQGQENFSVFGILQEKDFSTPMGIQRNREGEMQIRIREQHVASPVELAKLLPLQLINADSHRQLLSTPKYRRQFLDWGLFHVEQSFLPVWQRAARALKQRNAALRANASLAEIQLWSHELIAAAMPLDQLRRTYLQQLHPVFQAISQLFLENIEITWHYQRGWPADKDLETLFSESLSRDKEMGHTQYGPQRADLQLRVHHMPAQDVLSQGQQKLLVYALRLAQSQLLQQQTGRAAIYLIDDLPAELDKQKQARVAMLLKELKTQVFVTGIEKADLVALFPAEDSTLFHVEHGQVKCRGDA